MKKFKDKILRKSRLILEILRNFLAWLNIAGCKERNFWESQILMVEINANWDDVGCAGVVEKPTDIAVEVCIDAVLLNSWKSSSNSYKVNLNLHLMHPNQRSSYRQSFDRLLGLSESPLYIVPRKIPCESSSNTLPRILCSYRHTQIPPAAVSLHSEPRDSCTKACYIDTRRCTRKASADRRS